MWFILALPTLVLGTWFIWMIAAAISCPSLLLDGMWYSWSFVVLTLADPVALTRWFVWNEALFQSDYIFLMLAIGCLPYITIAIWEIRRPNWIPTATLTLLYVVNIIGFWVHRGLFAFPNPNQ